MVRQVPALVLLGVVFVVSAAYGASESLTNRTGRTGTAVTVTFSEEVRITSYGESVFPTKEPSSRSETFRFSGGQLENGARFSVSWTPSTAEITDTDWETTGASAASSSGTASAALTYEQIIAQIAHYPGPEEPLYVPAEGEQIWLTDLEGHADIYDNDSIKINYAPGFDKSQIARIDVYRNGVRLLFLPALFDVLTNEQMKTFDGNPEEHSPASSHTDHAIMGYDYVLKFYGSGNQPLAVRTTAIKSTFRFPGEYIYAALGSGWNTRNVLPIYWHDQLWTDELVKEYLRGIRADGYGGVMLDVLLYADGVAAPHVFAVSRGDVEKDSSLCSMFDVTARPEDLEKMLGLIEEVGLHADVRIQLDPTEKARASQPNVPIFDGGISPGGDPQAWFESYFQTILPYVEVAERGHAGFFSVFVENDLLMQYTEQMRWLLSAVDAVFSGSVYSSEGTNNIINRDVLPGVTFSRFWDYDDTWIGCTNFPVDLETRSDQRYSVITDNLVNKWRPVVAQYLASFPGHKIKWAEYGAYSSDGFLSVGSPDRLPSSEAAIRDDQEMADFYAAGLAAAAELGLNGVCIWMFEMTNTTPKALFCTLDEIPARQTIRAIISP